MSTCWTAGLPAAAKDGIETPAGHLPPGEGGPYTTPDRLGGRTGAPIAWFMVGPLAWSKLQTCSMDAGDSGMANPWLACGASVDDPAAAAAAAATGLEALGEELGFLRLPPV